MLSSPPPLTGSRAARRALRKTGGRTWSQLALGQGVAQHLFDAGVVALAGRSYALDDIGGEAEPDMDFRRRDRRAADPLPRLELLGKDLLERLRPREILFGPFRDFRLVPFLLRDMRRLFRLFAHSVFVPGHWPCATK